MSTDLDKQLIDDFQAISVLLALAAVLFGAQYQTILDAVRVSPIPEGPEARKTLRRSLKDTMLYRALPLALVSGGAAYLLLPTATAIALEHRFALWRFDVLRTGWVFIFALLTAVLGWSIVQVIALYRLVQRL